LRVGIFVVDTFYDHHQLNLLELFSYKLFFIQNGSDGTLTVLLCGSVLFLVEFLHREI